MKRNEMLKWLREGDEQRLERLWLRADAVRDAHVGDAVYLRGLIEISNHCARHCHYCGLRAPNRSLERYRMTADEILAAATQAADLGLGTVVLQAGEDPGLTQEWVAELVRRIKRETALAVTLSLGERREDEMAAWREAGADRYLLRFETSNRALYERIHPAPRAEAGDRIEMLQTLRRMGYEVGSGVMIGIPGQTYDDLVRDIEWFRGLGLDMIGVGPFIPHPQTPLGEGQGRRNASMVTIGAAETTAPDSGVPDQVPNSELMTYKVVALTRLMCPDTNIPSTTALASLDPAQGRELALRRGANIVMPNFTPPRYRVMYSVYPGKACVHEEAESCLRCIQRRIESIGRTVGLGRGDSRHYRGGRRAAATVSGGSH